MFLRIHIPALFFSMVWMLFPTLVTASTNAPPEKVFYVNSKFQGAKADGNSWLSAFNSLQQALNAAARAGGGEIWVKSGIYTPDGDDRNSSFELKQGIHLYGGFRGTETSREQRNPKANKTVLSGDIGRPGSTEDNCYHVVTAVSESSLNGFTLTKGCADGHHDEGQGGGIYVLKGTRNFTLTDCAFEGNLAQKSGGAIQITDSEITISNCTFFSNISQGNGGALATEGPSRLPIRNCTFSANISKDNGGALLLGNNAAAQIESCFFLYNSAGADGGALAAVSDAESDRPITLTQCTFQENKATGDGGAIHFEGPFYPELKQCKFDFNISSGAGAVGISKNCITLTEDCTFGKNRGEKGAENTDHDNSSSFAESQEALAQLKPEKEAVKAPIVAQNRLLPNVSVINPEDRISIKLRKIIEGRKYTLLVMGDITQPEFIKNYRAIEALAQNFESPDFQTFYIQRCLAHPENHGFLQPMNNEERIQQSKETARLLRTHIPWLCDTLENDVFRQLPQNEDNDVFIYSAEGSELFSGSLSTPGPIKGKLIELMGSSTLNIRAEQLSEPEIEPIELIPPACFDRTHFNPRSQKFFPLQLAPRDSRLPYYAKLRAEADEALLTTGTGKLYLGFNIDPLYHTQWNNRSAPLKYTLIPMSGMLTPTTDSAINIEPLLDNEPREFLIKATNQDPSLPILLRVQYSVYVTTLKSSIDVTQEYVIYLRKDPLAGTAYRRQIVYKDSVRLQAKVSTAAPHALLSNDLNKDGKISRNEVKGNLWSKFPDIDTNRDGYLNQEEYSQYLMKR